MMPSDTATPKPEQTPIQEMGERAAEILPGVKALGAMIGLENMRQHLGDTRAAVRADRQFQADLLGYKIDTDEEGDAMGDMIVTGDLTFNGQDKGADRILEALKGKVVDMASTAADPAKATPTTGMSDMAKKLALGAALAGTGLAGGIVGSWIAGSGDTPPTSQGTDTDTNAQWGFLQDGTE